jgi:hypothetical protein
VAIRLLLTGFAAMSSRASLPSSQLIGVIEQTTVLTNSFNFSTNGGCCNAENFARWRAVSVEYQKAQ